MVDHTMTLTPIERGLLLVIQLGLLGVLLLPLYVSPSMLYPFVSGKNFLFRILVEILFACWAGLALARPEFRPRFTPLLKAATVFLTVLFAADSLGPDPARSFFSNYERMEGFMLLGHLYLYFVMLVSLFQTRRDWLTFFHVTLGVSLLVSLLALLQKLAWAVFLQERLRVDSLLGNPGYLAGYLLFHIWLLVLLAYESRDRRRLCLSYLLALSLQLTVVYLTATRGAMLALLISGLCFLAGLVLFWNAIFPSARRARLLAAVGLVALLAAPLVLWLARDGAFVASSPVLSRLAATSPDDVNVRARLLVWQIALKGAAERPALGWGQENFHLVVQKYYDPRLAGMNIWFDRSHSAVLDWLVQAGVFGLLSFLSLIGVALWNVAGAFRRQTVSRWQGLALISLLIAHFVHNLFFFDNLHTYALFFGILAYTDRIRMDGSPEVVAAPPRSWLIRSPVPVALGLLAAAAAAGYFLHLKQIRESQYLARATAVYAQEGPKPSLDRLVETFQRALTDGTIADAEIGERMAAIIQRLAEDDRFTPEERKRFIEFTVRELEKALDRESKDVRHLLMLGSVLIYGLHLDPGYAARSEQVLQEALRMSPALQTAYFQLAQLYLSIGRQDRAFEVLRQAWALDRNSTEAGAKLWQTAILAGMADIVSEARAALDVKRLGEADLYRIALAYHFVEDFAQALTFYDRLVEVKPGNARYRASRAAILAHFGRIEEARREAREAARLDPALAEEAREFLGTLPQP